MSGALVRASALLEAAARERGVEVHRFDGEVMLCRDGERVELFHGFIGAVSKLAQALCGNDAWLRAYLARQGLPVVETRLVGPDDARFAQRAAEELGYPVRLRLVDRPVTYPAPDSGAFGSAWQAVVGQVTDQRSRLILERCPAGEPVEVAVIGQRTISSTSAADGSDVAGLLGVQVLTSLPGVSCGSVTIVDDSSRPVVDRVDLAFLGWIKGTTATAVAKAILSHTLPAGR